MCWSVTVAPPSLSLPTLPEGLGLVVVDLDGTLLDGEGRVPDALWPLLDRLRAHGAVLVPASGRQHATLVDLFGEAGRGMAFVAENGAYVARDGVEISADPLDPDVVRAVVAELRDATASGVDLGVLLCGKRSAYAERSDEAFLAVCRPYYRSLEVVEDLDAVPALLAGSDQVLKIAVHDFGSAERSADVLAPFADRQQVVVSGEHWVDVMAGHVDKGHAVASLQRELGVGPRRTVVFGDYLNDLGMLERAEASFAMAIAHPEVLRRARFTAPANTDGGVLQVLTAILDDLEA